MNELVFSFDIHSNNYCGIWQLSSDKFGFNATYRDAIARLHYDPRNFWDYRKFLVNYNDLDLLDQSIIKGPYRFRTLRKHIELTYPELLI